MKKYLSLISVAAVVFIFIVVNSVQFGQKVHVQDDFGKKNKETVKKKLTKTQWLKKAKEEKKFYSGKKEKEGEGEKFDDPDKFALFQKMIRTRDGEISPSYNVGYQTRELQKAIDNSPMFKANTNLNWIERGPGNVSGRTRGIIIDSRASDHRTWFAGSVGGGIFKTTDAGLTWVSKTTNMPNLATTVLAQSVSTPTTIYCGTGEGFYNVDAVNGGGIFKSTDGGDTWNLLSSTAVSTFNNINRIIVDPSNGNILLAATNAGPAGIWRSTDGGTSWARVFTGSDRVQDLRAAPGNFAVQYASVNSDGIYKSTDAGLTWTKASIGLPAGSRYEICVSPKNTQYLYANIEGASPALAVSKDGAASWSAIQISSGTAPDWFNSQGWYDNTMEAHPYNASSALFGGIDLWRLDLTGSQLTSSGLKSIDEVNTSSFLGFVNWTGSWQGSGLGKGTDFFNFSPFTASMFQLTGNEYVAVEIRFGPGISQKAHRFVKASNGDYNYADYVTVPFQVWDITNTRQLMVSFRDGNINGVFDLNVWDGGGLTNGVYNCREYLAINALPYNATTPDPNIAANNGIVYKNIYSLWPILASGTWNASSLPASTLRINWGSTIIELAAFTQLTDAYTHLKQYVHPDQHNIVVVPINESTNSFWIVNGNDGGTSLSTNSGTDWNGNSVTTTSSSGGYNTTQFYGVDKKPGVNEYFGGTQDNGTWLSPRGISANANSVYSHPIGGDGFEVSWNQKNGNMLIGGAQYNGFYRTTDGGTTWQSGTNGLTDTGSGNGCFISKIAENNTDPDVIYTTGKSGVWKSEDFGASWNNTLISGWYFNGTSTPAAISIAQPQNVWAGSAISSSYSYLWVSQDGGLSFTPASKLNFSMGNITSINTHPTEPNTAYITFSYSGSPKILRTTDLGTTWLDITGFSGGTSSNGFPNVATYCVLVMPYNTSQIWAGTEIGLMESIDGGATWHLANNGLPAASIWQMKIVDDQVVVATHGRGIWSVTLPQLSGYQPPVVTLSPTLSSVAQTLAGTISVTANLRSAYDSTKVIFNGTSVYKSINTAAGTLTQSIATSMTGTVNIQVIGYKLGRSYKSFQKSLNLLPFKPVQTTYINNFNTASSDFSGDGFTIAKPAGFSSNAIQSPHPYVESTTYTYILLVPIRVASTNSFIEYDDIAIVEPGDPGTKFGDANFWDYVVVEGSKDGVAWTPVADGYDSGYNARWSTIFTSGGSPDSTYYVHHKVDLRNKFTAGDQLMLRFRLFSDEAVTGWGWAIDNLVIQQGAVGIESESAIPTKFALMQNYPNPFNPATNIKFSLPKADQVKLEIYDSIGRLIETLVDTRLEAGVYNYKWNASGKASGVYIYRITAGSYHDSKKLTLLK